MGHGQAFDLHGLLVIGDLNGSGTENLYEIALRELEIPLFVEVLRHCEGNQSRAAAMLGIHPGQDAKPLSTVA